MDSDVLYVILDGAHARFASRSNRTGDFETFRELDGSQKLRTLRAELRASPPARSHESMSPTRRAVGPTGYVRRAKEEFAEEAADLACGDLAQRARGGVVLVAPTRLIGTLRKRMEGRVKIVGTLAKDLTKVPDHALGEHLSAILESGPA